MTPPLFDACEKAVHVISADGQVIKAGRAAMFILQEIGYYPRWLTRLLTGYPLVWFTELGYRLVAENRGLFSKLMFTREE